MSIPSPAGWPHPEHLVDHSSWRPDWQLGRRCVYWYVVADADQVGAALGPGLERAVGSVPWLAPVPAAWRHATVCPVGFADTLSRADVRDTIAAGERVAQTTEWWPPVLGGIGVMSSAVAVAVEPLDGLRQLESRLSSATEEALARRSPGRRCGPRPSRFWPHLSVGYARGRVAAAVAARHLGGARPAGTPLTSARLALVSVRRLRSHYTWDVLHVVDHVGRDHGSTPPGAVDTP